MPISLTTEWRAAPSAQTVRVGCELPQLPGHPREPNIPAHACANDLHPEPGLVGYCYVDAMQDRDEDGSPNCTSELGRSEAWRDEPDCIGDPALVEHCPAARRRTLRFLSAGLEVPVPHPKAALFIGPGW